MNWIDINVPKSRVCCLYFYATFAQQFYTTVFRIYSKISYCVKRPVIRTYWNIDKYYKIIIFKNLELGFWFRLFSLVYYCYLYRPYNRSKDFIIKLLSFIFRHSLSYYPWHVSKLEHFICFSTKFNFFLKHNIKPY